MILWYFILPIIADYTNKQLQPLLIYLKIKLNCFCLVKKWPNMSMSTTVPSPQSCLPLSAALHTSCSGSGLVFPENGNSAVYYRICGDHNVMLYVTREQYWSLLLLSELTLCGDTIPWMKSLRPSLSSPLPWWCRQLPLGSLRLSALNTACCCASVETGRGSIR